MSTEYTRNTQKSFTQAEIEQLLHDLGVFFKTSGQTNHLVRFASLRAPCSQGIYYVTGNVFLHANVRNSIILCDKQSEIEVGSNVLIHVHDPKLVFYELMRATCSPEPRSGIHPQAIVDPGAKIAESAWIGPFCVIEDDTVIGDHSFIDAHVVVKKASVVGTSVHIEPHCTIGATGIAWTWDSSGTSRVVQPQIGGVRIGNNVFIGSDVAIVKGSVNEITEIGDGCMIAHGSKIGHGCRLGVNGHLANNVSLAGNVDAGSRVFFGSGAIVRPRINLADDVVIGAGAVVTRDIDEPGTVVSGVPARPMQNHGDTLSGVPQRPSQRNRYE